MEGGGYAKTRIRARVSNILFLLSLAKREKQRERGRGGGKIEKSEFIEVENALSALLSSFSSSFSLAPPIKLRMYKREDLTAAVDLRSGEILPKRGEPYRGVHLCLVLF